MRPGDPAAAQHTATRHRRGAAILATLTLASCGAACILVLSWQGLAEAVEPHWTLQFKSLFSRSKAGIEVAVGPRSVLMLYDEARPHRGPGAALQKGLIWEHHGRVLVETGRGLGAPIIVAQGQRYHARTARIHFDPTATELRLRKAYVMDTVEQRARFLRRTYRPVAPIGEVAVTYVLQGEGVIQVEVDFTGLDTPWEQALLMNEQGARYFARYEDDTGLMLLGREIGNWQETSASRACLLNDVDGVQFCIAPQVPGSLFYGRERRAQWHWRGAYDCSTAGVGIALPGPHAIYRYRIELGPVAAEKTTVGSNAAGVTP